MDAEFWHDKWAQRQLGFHQSDVNPFLDKYFSQLNLPENSRIFVPLCGKTLDIEWLLSQGMQVCGVELSETAVRELFEELDVTPQISEQGPFRRYSYDDIDIFVGDFFKLTCEILGPVDAVYDRAALVALPHDMRVRYGGHLVDLSRCAPQLVITYVYDQSAIKGPPFSVDDATVSALYGERYALSVLEEQEVEGGMKGKCQAFEKVWHLASV